ncbi:MAG: DnaJ domain-containing protein [Deltaproteobacteria bacterium]|nr:DnaJ domain-containing protein [Deltaproteobacteria bacterium]
MDFQTAFEILGLDSNATIEEVKKVHRKFIAEWHPDKHTNNKIKLAVAVGVTKDLNSARDCLLEYLSQSTNQNPASPVMGQDAYDTNHISKFMAEVCSFDPFRGTDFEDLCFIYDVWCSERKLEPLSVVTLIDSLEKLGFFPIRKRDKSHFYFGLENHVLWAWSESDGFA